MKSIFDIDVSLGRTVHKKKMSVGRLTRKMFNDKTVFPMGFNPGDKDGPYYCPCIFNHRMRRKDTVKHATLLSIDVDNISEDEAHAVRRTLWTSGYEHLIYSTFSHQDIDPHFRIILRPSRTMSYAEAEFITHALATEIGIPLIDGASARPETPMFLPQRQIELADQGFVDYESGKAVQVEDYIERMLNYQSEPDEDETGSDQRQPLAVPAGLNQDMWLRLLLEAYPAERCSHYDDWFNVGAALWHQTEGTGFDLWLSWSRLNTERHGRKISESVMRSTKWPSMNGWNYQGKLVTIRHVCNQRDSVGRSAGAIAYANMIKATTDNAILAELTSDIRDDKYINNKDREYISKRYRDTYNRVNDDELSKGDVMAILKPEYHSGGIEKPYFKDRYVFNTATNAYCDIHSKQKIIKDVMNFMYGHVMPKSSSGAARPVHSVLTNADGGFTKPEIVRGDCFLVGGDVIEYIDEKPHLNLFDPAHWPVANGEFNPDASDIDAQIQIHLDKHLRLVTNGDPVLITMMKQHLAHLRQRPQVKLHFAYAIASFFQGVGKSTLQVLYSAVLGANHVGTLTAKDISSDFNGYAAAPRLMTFIEEFQYKTLTEKNSAINNLKQAITADQLSINEKNLPQRIAQTTTSYAIFSNDEYVLGNESTGRRWVPIVVNAASERQAAEFIDVPNLKQFFTDYYALLEQYPERFVALYESISLDGFDRDNPPESAEKLRLTQATPTARCTRVMHEIIDDALSIDITNEYVRVSSMVMRVQNYINDVKSEDALMLQNHTDAKLRHIIIRSLKLDGYSQIDHPSERIRLPFEQGDRVYISDLYVKDPKKYKGERGIRYLKRLILSYVDAKLQKDIEEGKKVTTTRPASELH